MALRKIKGEKRDGFVNLRMPEALMEKLNILAFLEGVSGADIVARAVQGLTDKEAGRIEIVRSALEAAKDLTNNKKEETNDN